MYLYIHIYVYIVFIYVFFYIYIYIHMYAIFAYTCLASIDGEVVAALHDTRFAVGMAAVGSGWHQACCDALPGGISHRQRPIFYSAGNRTSIGHQYN